jgi:hypothetical protein
MGKRKRNNNEKDWFQHEKNNQLGRRWNPLHKDELGFALRRQGLLAGTNVQWNP